MLSSITNHASWKEDKRFGDSLMTAKRWCDKQWEWFYKKADEKQTSVDWKNLAARIAAFIPLVVATIFAYAIGLVGIVAKSFSKKDEKDDTSAKKIEVSPTAPSKQ